MAKKNNQKRGLSLKQLKVIELLALKGMTNKTNQDIIEEVGITPNTFYEWKKQPEFVEELNRQVEFLNKAFLEEALGQLQRLISSNQVTDANKIKSIELFLKTQNMLKQTTEANINIKKEEESVDNILSDLGIEEDE